MKTVAAGLALAAAFMFSSRAFAQEDTASTYREVENPDHWRSRPHLSRPGCGAWWRPEGIRSGRSPSSVARLRPSRTRSRPHAG